MAVTITEILGTDSISGSRLTINANFLLLENAYNDLENIFNINILTGSLDVSSATSGQIKAKSLISNSLVMPSSGSPTIQIYGIGASAGHIYSNNTIASATGIFSNTLQTSQFSASETAVFGATAAFSVALNNNGKFIMGTSGSVINTNRKAAVGSTTAFPSAPNAGVTGTYANPYIPTLTENVLYIDSSYVDGGKTGFFLSVATGPNPGISDIPAGFMLTLIDTAATGGVIGTGQTGSTSYYTGFSTVDGAYPAEGIITPGNPYKSSLTLMWEPRIDQSLTACQGSWVILSSSSEGWAF